MKNLINKKVQRNSYSQLTSNERRKIIQLFTKSKNNSIPEIALKTNFTEVTINKVINEYLKGLKPKTSHL